MNDRDDAGHCKRDEEGSTNDSVFRLAKTPPLREDHREDAEEGETGDVAQLRLWHAVEIVVDPRDEASLKELRIKRVSG